MAQKVAYDTDKRIIYVTTAPVNGVVELDVQIDLYSDMKEDWRTDPALGKFIMPISSVGGNPLPGSKTLGDTYFLEVPWKIRPYEANHKLAINGNLFARDGTSVMVPTIGAYQVLTEMFVSNLSDSSIQQLTEIQYGIYNGGVSLDEVNGGSGQDYDWGTPYNPVDNWDDVVEVILSQKLPNVVYILGDSNITPAVPSLKYFTFIGQGMDRTTIDIDSGADVEDCAYYDAHVTGTLDGNSRLKGCIIDNLIYIKGYIEQCVLSAGTIVLGGSETAHFLDCWSGVPGIATPTIDMGGSGQSLALRNYNGGITIRNKTGIDKVSIDLNSGQVILENTVTAGEIVIRGVGKCVDENGNRIPTGTWNGCTIVNETFNGETLALIHAMELGRWRMDVNLFTMTFYHEDGVTPLKVFDLLGPDGQPNILNVTERVPQ